MRVRASLECEVSTNLPSDWVPRRSLPPEKSDWGWLCWRSRNALFAMHVASQDYGSPPVGFGRCNQSPNARYSHSGCKHPAVRESARRAGFALLANVSVEGSEVTNSYLIDGEYPGTSSHSEKRKEGCFRMSYSTPKQAFGSGWSVMSATICHE